jgi:histidine triad (HIT) family protein
MAKTVFERLIDREIPCHIVYENAQVFAFLDIAPRSPGHILVVPKEKAATMDALSDGAAAALGAVLPRLCRAVMRASGAEAYNVLQNNGAMANQEVPHVHIHIIPRRHKEEGLIMTGPTGKLSHEEGQALALRMRAELLD